MSPLAHLNGNRTELARARLHRLTGAPAGCELPPGDQVPPDPVPPDPVPADPGPPELPSAHPGRLIPGLRAARLGVSPVAARALALVVACGVLFAAFVLMRSRPATVDVEGRAAPRPPTVRAVASAPAQPSRPEVVVDVQGRVRDPGIVTLPAGSRVVDALRAAGGPRRGAKTGSVNLARVLADGEQIRVGGPPAAALAPALPSGPGVPAPVDLNTATGEQLETLPGVGPVLAQRILEFRGRVGRFSAVEELQEVPGIGPATYTELQPRVRV